MNEKTEIRKPVYTLLPSYIEGVDSLAKLALDMRWSWNHPADKVMYVNRNNKVMEKHLFIFSLFVLVFIAFIIFLIKRNHTVRKDLFRK